MMEYVGFPMGMFLLIGVAGVYLSDPTRRSPRRLAFLTGAAHFAAVMTLCLVSSLFSLAWGGGGVLFAYLLFRGMDMPLSLGYDVFALAADAAFRNEFVSVLLFFGVLGSLQYAAFGALLGAFLIALMKSSPPKRTGTNLDA